MPRLRTVVIRVNRETWHVPFGFGAAYARCAGAELATETTRDILELVGYTADLTAIATWPLRKRVDAEVYCASVHMRASDNPTPVPPRPDWMGEAWRGPQPEAALVNPFWEEPNVPTVLS